MNDALGACLPNRGEVLAIVVDGGRDKAITAQRFGGIDAAWLRTGMWTFAVALGAIYFVVVGSSLPAGWRLAFLEAIYCLPIALTVGFSVIARRRSEGAERRFWLYLGSANAILLACEALLIYWIVAIDPVGPPRVSWPFHIMHAFAAVFFIGILLSMSRFRSAEPATRLRWALDAFAVAVVLGVGLLIVYARPVMGPEAPIAHALLGAGYPLFGLVMLGGTLANIVGLKMDAWRSWDRLVAGSLALYAVAISLWPTWYQTAEITSRNYERGMLDLVQFFGHWILMMAALYRVTEDTGWRSRPAPPVSSTRHRWGAAIVPGVVLAAMPLISAAAYFETRADWAIVYRVAVLLAAALIVTRSAVIALEHGTLFHRSVTDPLSGLFNHRYFHDRLTEELECSARQHQPLGVVLLDLDDFGRYNERYGHMAGDRLLADVGALLRDTCDAECTVARLGGDEFGIIVPDADALDTEALGRRALDVICIQAGERPGAVTASAGTAVFPEHGMTAEQLLMDADGALFHAKESGKASVVAYDASRVPDLTAQDRIRRLERMSRLASIEALAIAVDARDPGTRDHSTHVAELSAELARRACLSDEEIRCVEMAAMLHDVGKIGMSDRILARGDGMEPGWDPRMEHVALGQQMLRSAGLPELLAAVRGHHESWDGSGKPDGLAGHEIPILARIISICDAYDALTTERTFRPALSPSQALSVLREQSGKRFDPVLVELFVAMMGSETPAPIASTSAS